MSKDFLLELLSEEIPARMQARARADLARLCAEALQGAGLTTEGIETFSTPRRLALIARGLADATEAVSEEIKGPRANAPEQALAGFLKKTGLTREQLEERDGVLFARIERPGRSAAEVLAEVIESIVRDFPWPKSMRWGAGNLRWVRPLHGIIALLGEEIVPVEVDGIAAGAATVGHRFHHPGQITIGSCSDYAEKLRACHVIVDHEEREAIVRDGAARLAAEAGLILVEDEGLVVENAGLTEWPVPLLGRFDPDFLDVPAEVIQLTARINQKYFVMRGQDWLLAPAFICVANIDANDGGEAIVEGNRRVLAARLSDARFFWEQDLKVPLEEQAKKLSGIVFHEKLGTVADKVERVAKLARWLVEEGIVSARNGAVSGTVFEPAVPAEGNGPKTVPETASLANQAERAALLAKADLVTGMVGEFPELQGVIGGYIAQAQGEPKAVADAIRDHYRPVGQGDEVPTTPVTVAVALADKLDTLVGFFAIDERPTGSKDPFALRRAILGVIEVLVTNHLRIGLRELFREAYRVFAEQLTAKGPCLAADHVDADYWSPILKDDAGYLRESECIILLREDPRESGASDEFGNPVWKASELRQLGLVENEYEGFVDTIFSLSEFALDRLRDGQRRAGKRPDIIQAVLPLGSRIDLRKIDFGDFGASNSGKRWARFPNKSAPDDVIRVLAVSQALEAFVGTSDGSNLLIAYKRAANILKKENWDLPRVMAGKGEQGIPQTGEEDPLVLVEEPAIAEAVAEMATGSSAPVDAPAEEKALVAALDVAGPKAKAAVEAEDFTAAMAALASLRGPIDAFFDKVTVNDPDKATRARRLNLLARFRDAVHQVADFSKIEG